MTRPAKPPMRARTSTVRRAPNGALHSVDNDNQSIEPFDDVHEHDGSRSADGAREAYEGHAGAASSHPAARRAALLTRGALDQTGAPAPSPDAAARQPHAARPSRAEAHPDAHEPLGPDYPLAPLPFNPYKGNRGITRAWHAMKNSFAGFQVAIREESAFRQELTLAAILLPCGVFVPVEPVARVMLLGSVLLVLIVELLNSSVEAAIDRISLERHELSRRAKDLGSAAVMVALGMCVMTWALIVGPLVVRWIGGWL